MIGLCIGCVVSHLHGRQVTSIFSHYNLSDCLLSDPVP